MTQKMIDSNIDKNPGKELKELFYSESNMKYLENYYRYWIRKIKISRTWFDRRIKKSLLLP